MNKEIKKHLSISLKLIKDEIVKKFKTERWVVVLSDSDYTCGIGGPGYLWKLKGQSPNIEDCWMLEGVCFPCGKDTFRFASKQEVRDWKENKKRAEL